MSDESSHEDPATEAQQQDLGRRLFLRSMGKWSGAAITAAVTAGWLATTRQAGAGGWVNRRGGGGGGWVNRAGGGGGGWINGGGGGWVNRR